MTCSDCALIPSLRCAACDHPTLHSMCCLGMLPLANALHDRQGEGYERFPLHVLVCPECKAVQLSRQVPPQQMFEGYPYFSSQSQTMLASARALVERMLDVVRPGELAMEIGSNDGYLLRWYAERGVPVVGVDPAETVAAQAEKVGVRTVVDWFGPAVAGEFAGQARVVHANNVLAHVPNPGLVLASAEQVLRPDGILVVETPWIGSLVDELQFDTIYHEHRWYWSFAALQRLFDRAGLEIVDVEMLPIHGGSMRLFAVPYRAWYTEKWHPPEGAFDRVLRMDDVERRIWWKAEVFGSRLEGRLQRLREWRDGLPGEVAGYGAAAKGAMMLAQIGPVDFVVDSTPEKQARFMPGVDVPILHPDALVDRMPPDCVVLAWNFAAEVAGKARPYTDAGGRLWTTTPRIERVGVRDAVEA